jgi:hypothetical protein
MGRMGRLAKKAFVREEMTHLQAFFFTSAGVGLMFYITFGIEPDSVTAGFKKVLVDWMGFPEYMWPE